MCHEGDSIETGHYVAFIRQGEKWFEVNDSSVSVKNNCYDVMLCCVIIAIKVSIISERAILNKRPYVLMYEEKSVEVAMYKCSV